MNPKYHKQYNAAANARRPSTGHASHGIHTWPAPQKPALVEICRSKDGFAVFDRPLSHNHVLTALSNEAISRVTLGGRSFVKARVEFGSEIGLSDCVATTEADKVVFAQRPGRRGLSRFAVGRHPEPCSSMITILKQREEDPQSYILITAFVGSGSEPEPWDKNASPASREFWSGHALVFGSCPIIPGTETSVCPW